MKTRFATLAIAALALWSIPSVGVAQGNSGKSRLTICHISPGKPDAGRTLTISESAWAAHEGHGDFLGPCEEYVDGHGDPYGADGKRAKKSKQKKGRDEQYRGSDRDAAEDEIGARGRAGGDRDADEADRSAERARRHAERRDREHTVRDQVDPRAGAAGRAAETTAPEGAGQAEAGAAEAGTNGAQAGEARGGRRAGAGERNPRGAQAGAGTEAVPETEPGFFRGVQQFFGFGAEEAKPAGADEPSGDAAE